jgi:hypothetical protein
MTDLNTQFEYNQEIQSIAYSLVESAFNEYDEVETREDAEELINDTLLHETIDGHQWVIYYSYNLDVIKYSDNEDYYSDNFGAESLASSLEQGLDTLHCHIAFWCMYADVQENLDAAFDKYEEDQAA